MKKKICDEKDLFCVPYTERFQNNFGLKFVQTISVFLKLTILKTLKLFLALSGRLMGYLKYPIKS